MVPEEKQVNTKPLLSTLLVLLACAGVSRAELLSIYDIQFNTTDGDQSIYDAQIHDVVGGIVTHKWSGFNDRVYLQDPAHPAWGGICVKDSEGDLFAAVQVGDWVSFENVYIEEYRGTTTLQYRRDLAPDVTFTIESSGHPLPEPLLLTAADLPVPVDHAASEPYESMLVRLEDVTVGALDLGKAGDNYELIQGDDVAWGTDYMNIDAGGPYHPLIHTGAVLTSITGIVEQYTKLSAGWDYYQLMTRSGADIVPEPATLALLLTVLALARGRR